MTAHVVATLMVAAALLVAPGPAGARARLRPARGSCPGPQRNWFSAFRATAGMPSTRVPSTGVPSTRVCGARVLGARVRGARVDTDGEPLALAGAWELLAACLRAGLPVPMAVRAVAEGLDAPAGPALRRTAELLALGAESAQAWQPALECPATTRLARAAQRSGRSGTAFAESLNRLAAAARSDARERSEARAQRAGVLIAAPLGLCFLPAFLAIGVVPVVLGLAAGLQQW